MGLSDLFRRKPPDTQALRTWEALKTYFNYRPRKSLTSFSLPTEENVDSTNDDIFMVGMVAYASDDLGDNK